MQIMPRDEARAENAVRKRIMYFTVLRSIEKYISVAEPPYGDLAPEAARRVN